ncbi:hypothetical protein [Streptomyces sp. NPDC059909]|uniref:hypothetical protein n=1 Tax=Streptomyces sp. NPDC059909 TaxID=3346998 RepID=UPI00365CD09B
MAQRVEDARNVAEALGGRGRFGDVLEEGEPGGRPAQVEGAGRGRVSPSSVDSFAH